MYVFQVIAFVLEVLLGLFFGGIIAVYPQMLISNRHAKPTGYRSYSNLKYGGTYSSKRKQVRIIGRILWSVIVIGTTLYFLKPYFLDIPKLIRGDLYYVSGTVYDIRRERRDPSEYVYIGGKKLRFFFSSNVERNGAYKIGYLPNTSRAIYCVALDNNDESKSAAIGFPFKDILIFLLIIAAFILLVVLTPFLRLKLFVFASAVYYPMCIYLYFKFGIMNKVWFSFNNDGLVWLVLGLVCLLTLSIMYLSEKYRHGEIVLTLIFAQVFAILKIIMAIILFTDS